jgi:hypothetical protein
MTFSLKKIIVLGSVAGGMALINGIEPLRAAGPVAPSTRPSAFPEQPTRTNQYDRHSRRNRDRGNSSVAAPTGVGSQSINEAILPLRSRSIFIKGNQAVINNDSAPSSGRSFATGRLVGRPESALVFNGVTIVNGEADALIEDTSSNRVTTVRPGDPIAGGKVSAITFDDLTYEVGHVGKRVAIGENLDGVEATFGSGSASSITPPSAPSTPASGVSASTAPPAGAAPSGVAPAGASSEDILARMKAARLSGK